MDQDQDNLLVASSSAVTLSCKSWTAYIAIVIRAVLLLGLCAVALYFQPPTWHATWIIAFIAVVGLLFIGYQFWLIRSYRLYYDDNGVWIYSGVLPWKRGVSGVKWRDLDEAVFMNGFWNWVSRSYTIQLKHRFTKANEIMATDMANGKQAVITINQQQQRSIAAERGLRPTL